MNNVEHMIKIHDVSTDNEIKSILDVYISDGYNVIKVDIIGDKKIAVYLEKTTMKNYYLFLDDERIPQKVTWGNLPQNVDWLIVRNYKQFIEVITKLGLPKHISFDHDLADIHYTKSIELNTNGGEFEYSDAEEKTGYDCAKWLVEYCRQNDFELPAYTVHSMSVVGKENIIKYLDNYKLWRINFK